MTKRKASVALDNGTESNQSNCTQDNNSSNSNSVTGGSTSSNNKGCNVNTQNGSSGNDDGQQHQPSLGGENSNSSLQHKSKKERADNWSSAEIQILHRGIDSRRDIFYGPPSQATKKNRELAWEEITKEVNSVSTTPRSLSQVMKKFKNEKCRAKRKFVDKDESSDLTCSNNGVMANTNSNNSNNDNKTTNGGNANNSNTLGPQNHATNNQQLHAQQLQQSHHMTNPDQIPPQNSINVVKLTPQNVAKTMIDLPGHVQQIQMPNDDMVLIVPPEMDSILSGMNIVSDALNNPQHNHQGPHTLQSINAGPSLVNGGMGHGTITRTIPAGSMCSLVYSTGGEVCNPDQHLANTVGTSQLSTNHISVNAHSLMHHRGAIDQTHGHHQQHQHHQSHPHHQQAHQQQQHQTQQQHQPQPQHQQMHQHQQQIQQHQHHLQAQNHPAATNTLTNNIGGVAVESQLKNLLFNLLLKEGQSTSFSGQHQVNQEYNKQRTDVLAIIANTLNKIEGHLGRISKVATTYFGQNTESSNRMDTSMNLGNIDNNNNSETIENPRGPEA